MKNLFKTKWFVLAMVVALAFGFAGCQLGGDEGGGSSGGWDETDYSDFSVMIRNNTPKHLIVFKESFTKENMVAGIPAGREQHGLKGNIFGNSVGIYKLLFVTKEDYQSKSLNSLANSLFTQLFVFWNGNTGDNEKVYDLSESLGGMNKIVAYNPSMAFNIELRLNGPSGKTLGFVQSGLMSTTFYVGDGSYHIFPVFRRYNSTQGRERLETLYPTFENGTPWRNSYGFNEMTPTNERTVSLDLSTALQDIGSMSSGVAYLVITNGLTVGGAIHLEKGDVIVFTAAGGVNEWNAGSTRVFAIDMATIPGAAADSFAATATISNYRCRNGNLPISFVARESLEAQKLWEADRDAWVLAGKDEDPPEDRVPGDYTVSAPTPKSIVVKNDYQYSVEVVGAAGSTTNAPRAIIELREGTLADVDGVPTVASAIKVEMQKQW